MSAPDLIRRNAALRKTMAKYRGRAFDWAGDYCIPMLRSHLVAMGHKRLPKVPRVDGPKGALAALKALGHADLAALLDSMLPRIPAARMLPGDVALMGGEDGLSAVVIGLGHKVWGWHADDLSQPSVIVPVAFEGVWRA